MDWYRYCGYRGKVTAIVGMIGHVATGASPCVVRAERDADTGEGIRGVTDHPTYPMESPEPRHVAASDHVAHENDTRKRDLITLGKETNLPFITHRDAAKRKSVCPPLDSTAPDPFRDNGYVAVREHGRSKLVGPTEAAENALRAFHYLVEDSTNHTADRVA